MAKRTIYSVDFNTGKKTMMAEFEIVKGKVAAKYAKNPGAEQMKSAIDGGLVSLKGKVVMPSDGQDFYDGLSSTFAQSSTMSVEDTK